MTATPNADPAGPSLADQVSRLYDLIAGYHLTHLIEFARELGAWDAITARPGIDSRALAAELGTDPDYTDVLCRTALAFELLQRMDDGWRMAPYMDAILGDPDSAFYLGRAKVHLLLGGEDYPDTVHRLRSGRVVLHDARGRETGQIAVGAADQSPSASVGRPSSRYSTSGQTPDEVFEITVYVTPDGRS